jgi:hypothetical protein
MLNRALRLRGHSWTSEYVKDGPEPTLLLLDDTNPFPEPPDHQFTPRNVIYHLDFIFDNAKIVDLTGMEMPLPPKRGQIQ